VGHLHLVDLNPAQLALAQLKIRLLVQATPDARLGLLGHKADAAPQRPQILKFFIEQAGHAPDIFGPEELVDALGVDHAGRYEILFHHLREALSDFRTEIETLLDLTEPAEQARRSHPGTPLGAALDRAFGSVMRIENLVCLFGEEATRNALRSFSSHFLAQLRHILATLPARGNPFLSQLLLGTFRHGSTYDWFQRTRPELEPEIVYERASAIEALTALPPASVDLVHLSNILDWLSPEDAKKTLFLAFRALRPRGLTVIRQLNSTLDIPAFEKRFTWRRKLATELHRKDRSFFYRSLHIGEKPRLQ
ncbi:MAG: DUF3419 family protein, partial [Verrucomicrobiaceae bacterium]